MCRFDENISVIKTYGSVVPYHEWRQRFSKSFSRLWEKFNLPFITSAVKD